MSKKFVYSTFQPVVSNKEIKEMHIASLKLVLNGGLITEPPTNSPEIALVLFYHFVHLFLLFPYIYLFLPLSRGLLSTDV